MSVPRPLLCAALLAGATPALAQTPVQLVQAGDGQKSCTILAAEINALATTAAPPKKKKGFGLGKMLSMASPMLGAMGGNGMTGAIMNQAAGVAQQGAMEAAMTAQTDAALRGIGGAESIEAQRKARLLEYFQAKGC